MRCSLTIGQGAGDAPQAAVPVGEARLSTPPEGGVLVANLACGDCGLSPLTPAGLVWLVSPWWRWSYRWREKKRVATEEATCNWAIFIPMVCSFAPLDHERRTPSQRSEIQVRLSCGNAPVALRYPVANWTGEEEVSVYVQRYNNAVACS